MSKKTNYNKIAITIGTVAGAYFLQKYANLLVIQQAEKDIQKAKKKVYGDNWANIDLDVQTFLIASGKKSRGENIDMSEVPTVQPGDLDLYTTLPFYNNPNWFKKYELFVPVVMALLGYGATQSKNQNIKSIGSGLITFGGIRLLLTLFQGTPKTFDMMYAQSIELDKSPNKFYSGYVYNKDKK